MPSLFGSPPFPTPTQALPRFRALSSVPCKGASGVAFWKLGDWLQMGISNSIDPNISPNRHNTPTKIYTWNPAAQDFNYESTPVDGVPGVQDIPSLGAYDVTYGFTQAGGNDYHFLAITQFLTEGVADPYINPTLIYRGTPSTGLWASFQNLPSDGPIKATFHNRGSSLWLGVANHVKFISTYTGDTTLGSPNLTGTIMGSELYVGLLISGPGVPANSYIRNIVSADTITLGDVATGNPVNATSTNNDATYTITGNNFRVFSKIYLFNATGTLTFELQYQVQTNACTKIEFIDIGVDFLFSTAEYYDQVTPGAKYNFNGGRLYLITSSISFVLQDSVTTAGCYHTAYTLVTSDTGVTMRLVWYGNQNNDQVGTGFDVNSQCYQILTPAEAGLATYKLNVHQQIPTHGLQRIQNLTIGGDLPGIMVSNVATGDTSPGNSFFQIYSEIRYYDDKTTQTESFQVVPSVGATGAAHIKDDDLGVELFAIANSGTEVSAIADSQVYRRAA